MGKITFGTEGWRGVLAERYTFDNVRASRAGDRPVVPDERGRWRAPEPVAVGHDTRFMGERFAKATADELAASGIEVHLCAGPLPTPALDYYVVSHGLAGGVMLTASHNPPIYNGFKVKRQEGCSIREEEAEWIEREANSILDQPGAQTPAEGARTRALQCAR